MKFLGFEFRRIKPSPEIVEVEVESNDRLTSTFSPKAELKRLGISRTFGDDEGTAVSYISNGRLNVDLLIFPDFSGVTCPFQQTKVLKDITEFKNRLTHRDGNGYVDICSINDLLNSSGVGDNLYRNHPAYCQLRAIHCVEFRQVHPDCIEQIIPLINTVFSIKPLTWDIFTSQHTYGV